MPRKAAAETGEADGAEPRRSLRIKDLPKPEPVVKKPRAKKAGKAKEEKAKDKPKSSRDRKRKEVEEPNSAPADEGDKFPPAKKAKPASNASAKPSSKAADKPPSKASAKPVSKASAKHASKNALKPESAKPASKVEGQQRSAAGSSVGETIIEETEAEAEA